jgi:hypothetical protein
MTTKTRKTQKDVTGKGKAGRPLELYDENGVQRNPLDGDEMSVLVKDVSAYFIADTTAASLFLLLLYALANEHDEAERSAVYYEACQSLGSAIEGVSEAFEADHILRLTQLRKRGA